MIEVIEAHKKSMNNRSEIEKSKICGCFYCLNIFFSSKICEWVDNDKTALCPQCGIDSIIGDASVDDFSENFFKAMNAHWFNVKNISDADVEEKIKALVIAKKTLDPQKIKSQISGATTTQINDAIVKLVDSNFLAFDTDFNLVLDSKI